MAWRIRAGRCVRFQEICGGNAVAPGALAAIQCLVGHLQHALGKASLAGPDSIYPAEAKTRRHLQRLGIHLEWRLRNPRAQLASNLERALIVRLRQHHGKLLTADASYPIDTAPKQLLQPPTKLL